MNRAAKDVVINYLATLGVMTTGETISHLDTGTSVWIIWDIYSIDVERFVEKMTETDYSDVITPTIVFYMLINLEKEHDETLC